MASLLEKTQTLISANLHDMVDQPAEKRQIGAAPQAGVEIGHGGSPRKPRVHVDDGRAALVPGPQHPAHRDHVVLRRVGPHDQNAIAVFVN